MPCEIDGEAPEVVSLDQDAAVSPDIVCTLGKEPIPLPDDSVDVAIAIHVLEHIGRQGETGEWFFFWEDLYRVMKHHGKVVFESPRWDKVWAWGDPTHTRVLSPEALCFFNQESYGIPDSAISPYRINCDFAAASMDEGDTSFQMTLVARKPLKPWWANGTE